MALVKVEVGGGGVRQLNLGFMKKSWNTLQASGCWAKIMR